MSKFKVGDNLVWSNERVAVQAAADGPRCLVTGEGWAVPIWVTDETLRYPNEEPRYASGGVVKGTGDPLAGIDNSCIIPGRQVSEAMRDALKRANADKQLVDYPNHDAVNHPKHYVSHPSGIETIAITRHETFLRGNILKYVLRAPYKGTELQDLRKAAQYLQWEIERVEQSGE